MGLSCGPGLHLLAIGVTLRPHDPGDEVTLGGAGGLGLAKSTLVTSRSRLGNQAVDEHAAAGVRSCREPSTRGTTVTHVHLVV